MDDKDFLIAQLRADSKKKDIQINKLKETIKLLDIVIDKGMLINDYPIRGFSVRNLGDELKFRLRLLKFSIIDEI